MSKDNKILSQVVFDNKTVSDLLKDAYDSVKEEDKTIKKTIESILSLYANNDASKYGTEKEPDITPTDLIAFVAPTIKDFMEVSVKNKKILIDIISVIQRLLVDRGLIGKLTENEGLLSVADREEILKNVRENIKKETDIIQRKIFQIDNEVQTATTKMENRQNDKSTEA